MGVASLYNVPGRSTDVSQFSFENQDSHTLIIAAIMAKKGITLPILQVDPIPLSDFRGWSYRHQALHNAMNAVLGIQGNDLTDVDFSQKSDLENWIYLHASEHIQAHQILRI